MTIRHRALIAGAAALALAAGGVGVADAVGGDDDDAAEQATGSGAEKAKAAALQLVSGGTSTAVERDDELGATWEVEIRRPDGSVVDVRLDAGYEKVAIDADSESHDSDE